MTQSCVIKPHRILNAYTKPYRKSSKSFIFLYVKYKRTWRGFYTQLNCGFWLRKKNNSKLWILKHRNQLKCYDVLQSWISIWPEFIEYNFTFTAVPVKWIHRHRQHSTIAFATETFSKSFPRKLQFSAIKIVSIFN